jgi:hypothetical protein
MNKFVCLPKYAKLRTWGDVVIDQNQELAIPSLSVKVQRQATLHSRVPSPCTTLPKKGKKVHELDNQLNYSEQQEGDRDLHQKQKGLTAISIHLTSNSRRTNDSSSISILCGPEGHLRGHRKRLGDATYPIRMKMDVYLLTVSRVSQALCSSILGLTLSERGSEMQLKDVVWAYGEPRFEDFVRFAAGREHKICSQFF